MPLPSSLRSVLPLVAGLVVGGLGASLFRDSLPGDKGSPEERIAKLEVELKTARNQIAGLQAIEAENSAGSRIDRLGRARPARTLTDGARSIAADIRAGREVSPDDIFRATQPLIRDLAPLFDRMRVKQQAAMVDSLSGELARKYQLTPAQQASLRQWFLGKSEEAAKRWTEMLSREGTRFEDVVKASHDVRPDEGIEQFMEGVLTGDKLAAFKTDRLNQRAERMQREADRKVQRIDAFVRLDEGQRDQIFGMMARSSPDYDPSMVLEGSRGVIPATPVTNRQEAVLAVLRPDQRAAYESERQRRREAAQKDMAAIGMKLPEGWEMLDDADF